MSDAKPERPLTRAIQRMIAHAMVNGDLRGGLGNVGFILEEPIFLRLCAEHGTVAEHVVLTTAWGRTEVMPRSAT